MTGGGSTVRLACAATALLALLLHGPAWPADLARTDGVVRNLRDRQPLAGVRVTAECRQNQFHGSRVLTTIATDTDANGRFAFEKAQLEPCEFMYVRAAKDGFVMTSSLDVRYGYAAYARVPAEVFLTPADATRLQRLDYEFAVSNGRSLKPNPAADYRRVFTGFHCSRLIAQTAEETAYVRAHYCERLQRIEAELNDEGRAALPAMAPQICESGPFGRAEVARVNPDEVHEFCGSR